MSPNRQGIYHPSPNLINFFTFRNFHIFLASGWSYFRTTCPTLVWFMVVLFRHIYWPLRWRHNDGDSVSNHQPRDCLLNCLFGRTSKKTSKLRVTGLCVGNSPWTGEFPAQMASNAENVSISWRHHGKPLNRFTRNLMDGCVTNFMHGQIRSQKWNLYVLLP